MRRLNGILRQVTFQCRRLRSDSIYQTGRKRCSSYWLAEKLLAK
ncbi:unnamed protein product [Haemonchus placei]|uniref:Transposase n=1 Tax=Haemonchus placei TaxID=6290 RepID=A0A0N4VXF0_HAEPC|nr:unnamed protein product [Haemonchus placei]